MNFDKESKSGKTLEGRGGGWGEWRSAAEGGPTENK